MTTARISSPGRGDAGIGNRGRGRKRIEPIGTGRPGHRERLGRQLDARAIGRVGLALQTPHIEQRAQLIEIAARGIGQHHLPRPLVELLADQHLAIGDHLQHLDRRITGHRRVKRGQLGHQLIDNRGPDRLIGKLLDHHGRGRRERSGQWCCRPCQGMARARSGEVAGR
jgi:hypothetical protein